MAAFGVEKLHHLQRTWTHAPFELLLGCLVFIIISAFCFSFSLVVSDVVKHALQETPSIRGTGSNFAGSLYSLWFSEFPGICGYDVSNSAEGIKTLLQESPNINFAGVDTAIRSQKELKEHNLLQFPIVGASLVLIYNVPDRSLPLNFTMDAITEIWNGSLTWWDDDRIVEINSKLKLPHKKIIPIHFTSPSGCTLILSQTLSSYSEYWNSTIGSSEMIPFPVPNPPGVDQISTDQEMLREVDRLDFTVGYVLYPSVRNQKDLFPRVHSGNICTPPSNSDVVPSISCSILTDELQEQSFSTYSFSNKTGVAEPLEINFDNRHFWPFNGFTYWYTLEEYAHDKNIDCFSFINHLRDLLSWVYKSSLARELATSSGYVMLQSRQWSAVKPILESLECEPIYEVSISFFVGGVAVGLVFLCFVFVFVVRIKWLFELPNPPDEDSIESENEQIESIPLL